VLKLDTGPARESLDGALERVPYWNGTLQN